MHQKTSLAMDEAKDGLSPPSVWINRLSLSCTCFPHLTLLLEDKPTTCLLATYGKFPFVPFYIKILLNTYFGPSSVSGAGDTGFIR